MGIFKLNDAYISAEKGRKEYRLIKKEKWGEFKSDILGLGTIGIRTIQKSVVCAFFDLQGFSKFCNKEDSGQIIPKFLNKYLDWFFHQILEETKCKEYNEGIATYHDLPFFVKFLGDGLMILWDISDIDESSKILGNIILSTLGITEKYSNIFLPDIRNEVGNPPSKLRCGIAKGSVYSVGNNDGQDFVGTCINKASRLQNLPGITFAFSNVGITGEAFKSDEERFIKKHVDVRGIGEDELISILKNEYDNLDREQKKTYTD